MHTFDQGYYMGFPMGFHGSTGEPYPTSLLWLLLSWISRRCFDFRMITSEDYFPKQSQTTSSCFWQNTTDARLQLHDCLKINFKRLWYNTLKLQLHLFYFSAVLLLTLWAPIPQNGQTHSNNSSEICQRIVWVCLIILWNWRVKG